MLHGKHKNCREFMAKSPNGKIVLSLYRKIAYVWTRPKVDHFERQPIFCFNQNGFGDISRNEHQSEKGLDRLSQVS